MNNKLGIPNFKKGELEIKIEDNTIEDTVSVNWIGRVYMLDPTEIVGPYLNELHEKILKNGLKHVRIDFTRLRLLNSSGLKAVIKWFKLVSNLSEDVKYKIKLVYDGKSEWQTTSLSMLTELFPEVIEKIPK